MRTPRKTVIVEVMMTKFAGQELWVKTNRHYLIRLPDRLPVDGSDKFDSDLYDQITSFLLPA